MYLKKKDPGLSYIRRIGITPAASTDSLVMSMRRTCGDQKTDDFFNNYPESGETKEFYEYKNSDEKIASLFTGGFDADIIRQSANWIFEHKNAFGKEILEIGCDIGFMTGFLAITFPDAHITAIDRCDKSISLAQKLLEKLHVTNVDLICTDLKNLDENKTFDTIFSMRCINENLDERYDLITPTFDVLMDDLKDRFLPAVQGYFMEIVKHLDEHGALVTITNAGLNPVTMAWMIQQNTLSLEIDQDSYKKIKCKGPDSETTLQAFYSKWHLSYKELLDKSRHVDVQKLGDLIIWCGKNFIDDTSAPAFENWDAEIMRYGLLGDLLEGIAITNSEGKILVKYCIYTDRIDPTALLLYHANLEAAHLEIYEIKLMDQIKQEFSNIRNLDKPDVKYAIENQNWSMWPVIRDPNSATREILDTAHKIH